MTYSQPIFIFNPSVILLRLLYKAFHAFLPNKVVMVYKLALPQYHLRRVVFHSNRPLKHFKIAWFYLKQTFTDLLSLKRNNQCAFKPKVHDLKYQYIWNFWNIATSLWRLSVWMVEYEWACCRKSDIRSRRAAHGGWPNVSKPFWLDLSMARRRVHAKYRNQTLSPRISGQSGLIAKCLD